MPETMEELGARFTAEMAALRAEHERRKARLSRLGVLMYVLIAAASIYSLVGP